MQSRILLHSCHLILDFDPLKLARDLLKVVAVSPRNLLKMLTNGSPEWSHTSAAKPCMRRTQRPLPLPDLCGLSLSTCRRVVLQQCQSLSSPQTSPTGHWNPSRHCWSHSQPWVVSILSGVRKEDSGYSSVSFALLYLNKSTFRQGLYRSRNPKQPCYTVTPFNHVILLHHLEKIRKPSPADLTNYN